MVSAVVRGDLEAGGIGAGAGGGVPQGVANEPFPRTGREL